MLGKKNNCYFYSLAVMTIECKKKYVPFIVWKQILFELSSFRSNVLKAEIFFILF